jgi:hypothetical protein
LLPEFSNAAFDALLRLDKATLCSCHTLCGLGTDRYCYCTNCEDEG